MIKFIPPDIQRCKIFSRIISHERYLRHCRNFFLRYFLVEFLSIVSSLLDIFFAYRPYLRPPPPHPPKKSNGRPLSEALGLGKTNCWPEVNYILFDVFMQPQGLSVRRVPSTQDCYVFKLDPSLPTPQKMRLDMEQVRVRCKEENVSVRIVIHI